MINTLVIPTMLLFVLNAIIGAIAYIFFWSIKDRNVIIRQLVLAGIAGYIYWYMYNTYTIPNSLISVVIGWFAPDFIEAVMEKYKPKHDDT